MKLIIVSGLSGSGKSVALHTLEDLGFYCIDNLPASLLSALAAELDRAPNSLHRAAVGIDARNMPKALERFSETLKQLTVQGITTEILYLGCDTNTLLKRFSETRRRHPLSNRQLSLEEAIESEQKLLEPIFRRADLFIDTTHTTIHQLRDQILQRITGSEDNRLSLLFKSFGFKHGIPPDADFVFDVRCLPNPHWEPELRALTGHDPAVIRFLDNEPKVQDMLDTLRTFFASWIPAFEADNRSYLTIAIGCTGGQHRSVYLTEQLASHFAGRYPGVVARHRELP